jgi:hypothetical protein
MIAAIAVPMKEITCRLRTSPSSVLLCVILMDSSAALRRGPGSRMTRSDSAITELCADVPVRGRRTRRSEIRRRAGAYAVGAYRWGCLSLGKERIADGFHPAHISRIGSGRTSDRGIRTVARPSGQGKNCHPLSRCPRPRRVVG